MGVGTGPLSTLRPRVPDAAVLYLSSKDTPHLRGTKRLLMVTVPTLKQVLRKGREGEALRGLAWAEGLAAGLVPLVTGAAPASCPNCEDSSDCANVNVCGAVEEVYREPELCSPESGSGNAGMSITAAVAPLSYNGIAIRDRDGKLNLTDMWKAAGKDPARQPAKWMASADAMRFKDFLAESQFLQNSEELVDTKTGPDGGTWAHWQLGIAYAKYLSPAFHAWRNQVIRDRMEGKIGRPEELAVPAFNPNDARQLRATLLGYSERVIALEDELAAKERVADASLNKRMTVRLGPAVAFAQIGIVGFNTQEVRTSRLCACRRTPRGQLRLCAAQMPHFEPCLSSIVVAAIETGFIEEACLALIQGRRLHAELATHSKGFPWFLRRPEDLPRFGKAFSMAQLLPMVVVLAA